MSGKGKRKHICDAEHYRGCTFDEILLANLRICQEFMKFVPLPPQTSFPPKFRFSRDPIRYIDIAELHDVVKKYNNNYSPNVWKRFGGEPRLVEGVPLKANQLPGVGSWATKDYKKKDFTLVKWEKKAKNHILAKGTWGEEEIYLYAKQNRFLASFVTEADRNQSLSFIPSQLLAIASENKVIESEGGLEDVDRERIGNKQKRTCRISNTRTGIEKLGFVAIVSVPGLKNLFVKQISFLRAQRIASEIYGQSLE